MMLLNDSANSGLDQWRWKVLSLLRQYSKNQDVVPYIAGLLVGETQWLNAQQWQRLVSTGTIHLMAISGLHIGLAAMIGFWFGQLLQKILALLKIISGYHQYLAIVFSQVFAVFL